MGDEGRQCLAEGPKALVEPGEHLGMGDLRDPDTWLGPIISDRQRNRVRTHIEDAKAGPGYRVVGGLAMCLLGDASRKLPRHGIDMAAHVAQMAPAQPQAYPGARGERKP